MVGNQFNNLTGLRVERPPIIETIGGGASTVLFGGLAVVEGIAAALNQDAGFLRPTALLAALAYSGYRVARKGYDRLCSPEAYTPIVTERAIPIHEGI